MFVVPNLKIAPEIVENGKALPVVNGIHVVLGTPYENPDCSSVNESALMKDDKGTYVWKAVGQKTMKPGVVIDQVFSIRKVYIEPNGRQIDFAPGSHLVEFKNNPDLKYCDVVVSDIPEGMKDGDRVAFSPERYTFMPGDNVRVVIK